MSCEGMTLKKKTVVSLWTGHGISIILYELLRNSKCIDIVPIMMLYSVFIFRYEHKGYLSILMAVCQVGYISSCGNSLYSICVHTDIINPHCSRGMLLSWYIFIEPMTCFISSPLLVISGGAIAHQLTNHYVCPYAQMDWLMLSHYRQSHQCREVSIVTYTFVSVIPHSDGYCTAWCCLITDRVINVGR